jgi:O-antigen ligase
MAGGGSYLLSRYGGAKAIPYAAVISAVILIAVGGRQGDISGGGTAHERLMLWADGLGVLFSRPVYLLTGLGNGWFAGETGLVAHNSFIQSYVEFGILGGGLFLASFYLGARLLYQLGGQIAAPDWAIQSRHYGFAVLVGYAVGSFSLTRNLSVPTYLILGIASILLESAAPTLPEQFHVSGKWMGWVILFGICGLVLLKFTTQGLGVLGI